MSRLFTRSVFISAVFAALIASASYCSAATITHAPLAKEGKLKGVELLLIQGEITRGDEEKFRVLSVVYDKALVALDSPGGSLLPAIEIGKMIHLKEYSTLVAKEDACTSACALIWVAGSTRFLSPNGRVGFHASYKDSSGGKQETGVGNALVGHYLGLLNLSEKAIIFATAAPPDKIQWLSQSTMSASGIDFKTFNDGPTPPPLIRVIETPPSSLARAAPPSRGWEKVGTSNGKIYYMDHERVSRVGPYLTAWVRVDHRGDSKADYAESKDLWYFDCSSRRLALKAYATYDLSGNRVDAHELLDGEIEWQSAIPESIGEADLDFVCS